MVGYKHGLGMRRILKRIIVGVGTAVGNGHCLFMYGPHGIAEAIKLMLAEDATLPAKLLAESAHLEWTVEAVAKAFDGNANLLKHAVLALLGGVGYCTLAYVGFAYAPVSHAGVFVNGGIGFWTIVIMAFMTGFHIPRQTVVALVLTTSGLLLIGYESLVAKSGGEEWLGDLLFLAAALTWAVFGLVLRRWQIRPQLGVLGIAVFSALVYLPVYAWWLPSTLSEATWGAITLQAVYQGVVIAFLGAGLYSYAVQKIGASEASLMLALVPAVSAVGGLLILGEQLGTVAVLGIVVVSIGAVLGSLPPGKLKFGRWFKAQ